MFRRDWYDSVTPNVPIFVCFLDRGQLPKNFWSTSSSLVTPRRRLISQNWLTATDAGSQRDTERNQALTTPICESQEHTSEIRDLKQEINMICGWTFRSNLLIIFSFIIALAVFYFLWLALSFLSTPLLVHTNNTFNTEQHCACSSFSSCIYKYNFLWFTVPSPIFLSFFQGCRWRCWYVSHLDIPHSETQLYEQVTERLHTHRLGGNNAYGHGVTYCVWGFIFVTVFFFFTVRRFSEKATQVAVLVCFGNTHLQRGMCDIISLSIGLFIVFLLTLDEKNMSKKQKRIINVSYCFSF